MGDILHFMSPRVPKKTPTPVPTVQETKNAWSSHEKKARCLHVINFSKKNQKKKTSFKIFESYNHDGTSQGGLLVELLVVPTTCLTISVPSVTLVVKHLSFGLVVLLAVPLTNPL